MAHTGFVKAFVSVFLAVFMSVFVSVIAVVSVLVPGASTSRCSGAQWRKVESGIRAAD